MNALELWLLKRLCDKHGVDYQEIDNTLTYWENKKHIQRLVYQPIVDFSRPLDPQAHLTDWEAQMEEYLAHHPLEHYVCAIEAGETVSSEVGEPYIRKPPPPPFSLVNYVGRSNHTV